MQHARPDDLQNINAQRLPNFLRVLVASAAVDAQSASQSLRARYAWRKPVEDRQISATERPWSMKKITPVLLTLLVVALSIASPSAGASELIYSQTSDGQSVYGPSLVWPADGVNKEVADEFNVVANIDRVFAGGSVWGTVNFQGVYVRFYEFGADNKPGALQREYFLAAGDPAVTFDANGG